MTIKGIRQTITAIPFGSEGGMAVQINNGKDVITLPINDRVSWLKDGERIEGHIYSENQILVEDGDSVKIVEVEKNGIIAYKNEQTAKEERGVLVIIENNFDIKYSAMDIQALHSNLYLSCFIPENGKLGGIKALEGRKIEISPCGGIIDGLGFQILAKQIIQLDNGGIQKRIDSIVLRKDQVNRRISIAVLKGDEGNNPKPKALQRDKFSTYEMLIGTVVVDRNAVEVDQSQFSDKRITLDNYYGADYIIETYQDLVNLTGNKTAKNVILMSDIELDNNDKVVDGVVEVSDVIVNIPDTVETFRSLNNSTINGVITFNGGKIENVKFIGTVNASNTKFENVKFIGTVNASNTKFEYCRFEERHKGTGAIKTICKCNFSLSCYVNDGLIGEIKAFAGEANKVPKGWLICNGFAIDRNEYSALFSVIGTSWGIGDGAKTFNIPDARSGVLKGVGKGILEDPDRCERFAYNGGNAGDRIGSYQRFANHYDRKTQGFSGGTTVVGYWGQGAWGILGSSGNVHWRRGNVATAVHDSPAFDVNVNFTVDLTYGTGNSTRDNNISVNFIIKAK